MKAIKIQFAFHALTMKLLERLVKERGAPSKAEIIRDSLSVFEWVHDQVKHKHKVVAVDKNGSIIEPVWSHVFPHQKSISMNAPEKMVEALFGHDNGAASDEENNHRVEISKNLQDASRN